MVAQGAALFGLSFHFLGVAFALGLIVVLVLGTTISYLWRKHPQSERAVLPGAIFTACLFFVAQFFGGRLGRQLPLEVSLTGSDLALFLALSFTAVAASFFWLNDVAVLFSCVWSIAIVGVAATTNLSSTVIVCFVLYLFAALFQLLHHTILRQVGPAGLHSATRGPLLLLQLRSAGLLWAATLVFGFVVAVPLQMLGRNLSLSQILDKLKVSPKPVQGRQKQLHLLFDNQQAFSVGLGPVQDDDTLLYRVRSPKALYWRSKTFAICDGNQWVPFQDDLSGQALSPRASEKGLNVFTIPPALEGECQKTERVHAAVEPVASVRAICHITELRQLHIANQAIVRRIDGTVTPSFGPLDLVGTIGPYEIDSDVSVATPADLNRTSQDYPPEILRRYLQEPQAGLLDKLMLEAVGNAKGPYDRAEAIRKFIANRCTYTLDAPPCPPGRNPAQWFLEESRSGYCDLYATATTLLCRAAGIPARLATGFNAGEVDAEHEGAYNLRERNRHAWCEVFFTGYGWIPFDATVFTTDATTAPVAIPPSKQKRRVTLPTGPLVLATLGVLGLAGVGTGELLRRRQRHQRRAPTDPRAPGLRQLARSYGAALQLLKRQGVPRTAMMTTGEHLDKVEQVLGQGVAEAYGRLARLCDRALFGADVPTDDDMRRAREGLQALRAALKERH